MYVQDLFKGLFLTLVRTKASLFWSAKLIRLKLNQSCNVF